MWIKISDRKESFLPHSQLRNYIPQFANPWTDVIHVQCVCVELVKVQERKHAWVGNQDYTEHKRSVLRTTVREPN